MSAPILKGEQAAGWPGNGKTHLVQTPETRDEVCPLGDAFEARKSTLDCRGVLLELGIRLQRCATEMRSMRSSYLQLCLPAALTLLAL